MVGILWGTLTAGTTAQAQEVGGLRGMVEDADFREGVPGVRVILEGKEMGAITDREGKFFINAVAPGIYTLTFSTDGYARTRKEGVVVAAGSVRDVGSIDLVATEFELDPITMEVDDSLGFEPSAGNDPLILTKGLDSIGQRFGAAFLTQLGGRDVGSALKKLAGISTTGGGRYVVIRGLADRYNVVLLNGAKIPSSDPDRRAVNVDIFPSKLIDNIVSSKTATADLPGEVTGGMINLYTKAIPQKNFAELSLSYGFNTIATGNANWLSYQGPGTGWFGTRDDRRQPLFLNQLNKEGGLSYEEFLAVQERSKDHSLLSNVLSTSTKEPPLDHNHSFIMGKRFEMGGHPAGFVVGFSHAKRFTFQDDVQLQRGRGLVEISPTRQFTLDRGTESLLAGGLMAIGIEPTDTDSIQLTFFGNLAADDRAVYSRGLDESFGFNYGDFQAGYYTTEQESLYYVERRLKTLQLHGEHKFEGLKDAEITWTLAGSNSSQDEPDLRYFGTTLDLINFGTPTYVTLSGLSTPFLPRTRFWRYLDDYNYNAVIEAKIPLFYSADGKESWVKFGANFDYSTRSYTSDDFAYSDVGTYQNTGSGRLSQVFLNPAIAPQFESAASPFIGPGNPPTNYDANQILTAAYGEVKFDIVPNLDVQLGARVENTHLQVNRLTPFDTSSGSPDNFFLYLRTIGHTNELRPNPERYLIDRTDVLPSFAANWEFAKNMKLRLAASRTVARPSFKEVAPVWYFEPDAREIFFGNLDLKMSDVTNLDARVEYTPVSGEVIAATGFTKSIRNPIELVQGGNQVYYDNQPTARVYGFELEFQRKLDFVDLALKPFSIGANYAYIYSQVELQPDFVRTLRLSNPNASATRRLQGQPDYLLNFNLSYDNPDTGLFAGLFFNVTGNNLIRPGSDAFTPNVFEEPISTLDFTISRKFKNDWKLTFRAANLLESPVQRYYDTPLHDNFERYDTPVVYSLGLSKSW